MTAVYLQALVAMALALSILMALAWVVQQRTGNSGWVDTIRTFAVGLVGAGGALWPVTGSAPHARQWLVAGVVAIWSLRLGLHIATRSAAMTDDPRYAAPAREWEVNSARRMFTFPQNRARYRACQARTSRFFPLPPAHDHVQTKEEVAP